MSTATKIEWTDVTWNPTRGCSRVSAGCEHCYAERVAYRFSGPGQPYRGLAHKGSDGKPHWTGKVVLDEAKLLEPLHWRKPRRVFVNSMSDLFHEALTDEQIDRVFAVMALCPQHTFQVLTKRAKRMREWASNPETRERLGDAILDWIINRQDSAEMRAVTITREQIVAINLPLPNVWLGVSAEDQAAADERIPELLATPAAVRFVSLEPLLGPLSIERWVGGQREAGPPGATYGVPASDLDWVIVGGESGPGARPMHPDWPRQIRDQCAAAGVPFFFKQWGEWAEVAKETRSLRTFGSPEPSHAVEARFVRKGDALLRRDGQCHMLGKGLGAPEQFYGPSTPMRRVGKRAAGRLLDGRTHDDLPWRTETLERGKA